VAVCGNVAFSACARACVRVRACACGCACGRVRVRVHMFACCVRVCLRARVYARVRAHVHVCGHVCLFSPPSCARACAVHDYTGACAMCACAAASVAVWRRGRCAGAQRCVCMWTGVRACASVCGGVVAWRLVDLSTRSHPPISSDRARVSGGGLLGLFVAISRVCRVTRCGRVIFSPVTCSHPPVFRWVWKQMPSVSCVVADVPAANHTAP